MTTMLVSTMHSALRNLRLAWMVLVVGFTTVTFSDMRDQRIFASMGVLTMLTAMIGDLIILPALLAVYALPTAEEKAANSASS